MKNITMVMDMAQIIIDIMRIILLVVRTMDNDDHSNSSKDRGTIMTHTHRIISRGDINHKRREYVTQLNKRGIIKNRQKL